MYTGAGCPGFNADSSSWLTCAVGIVPNDSGCGSVTCKVETAATGTSEGCGSQLIRLKCLVLGEHWIQGRSDPFYSPTIEPGAEHLVAA